MKLIKNMVGGFAGAIALNILHETVKRIDHDAPRVDLIGEEGLNKILEKSGTTPLHGNGLFVATLAGDIISNGLYYSQIGVGKKKHLLVRGAVYGVAAGAGALLLTKPIGLSDAPVTRTQKTKALTIGYYLLGGLVTALCIKALRK